MPNTELPKAYDPQSVEKSVYERWEASGFFNPDNLPGDRSETFSIMMPPPNVTGILHLGHALENAIMDIQIRYQRLRGRKALLLPGTDHAAVATQAKVEGLLKKEGMENPRRELGREELLRRIREYAEQSKATIISQVRALGTSCDWSRLAYTLDESRSAAVFALFKHMYDDGLIYRGYRVINWSVKGQSTCSDDELEYTEESAKLYTFKYSKDFPIPIATTRPETKLGDTAVAVNPNGKWKEYIGQTFTIDNFAGVKLTIQVIGDEAADDNFGTGAVGVTPAHSLVDYEMMQRHPEIGLIPVITAAGLMTDAAGGCAGLTVEQARERVVGWLRDQELLMSEEDIVHNVGRSDRFKDIVEALPMEQWFIAVNRVIPGRGKTLKDLMREAVAAGHGGDSGQKITIAPERFEKIYFNWIDNLRDWCISRQIWWGHRIPVWYRGDEVIVSATQPEGEGWRQDEDTLDTWFSSGAWTFSTLGWPEQTPDLQAYHPTSWMQMGKDILFFWMARMILMTTYALDTIPFRDAYIHGMVRDEKGAKFSKSADNGLDPIEMIGRYGADALRLTLIRGVSPGNDSRFTTEKIEAARNFVNKLWNISRYIFSTVAASRLVSDQPAPVTLADAWILRRLGATIADTTTALDRYDFSAAEATLTEFTRDDFADWYLEVAKIEGSKDDILLYIIQTILKLWHPFIPFVTETIWEQLATEKLLMASEWPTTNGAGDSLDVADFDRVKEIITTIRAVRSEYRIDPAKFITATVSAGDQSALLEGQAPVLERLARCRPLSIVTQTDRPADSIDIVVGNVHVYLHIAGVVDMAAERQRIETEIVETEQYVRRVTAKLGNQDFVANAPAEIVALEREKLTQAESKLGSLQRARGQL